MYFDAHAHLQQLPRLQQAILEAQRSGVHEILCNAIYESDWPIIQKIAQQYSGVHVALGVHPCAVSAIQKGWVVRLEKILKNNPNVIVGEIGLDAQYPNLDDQELALRQQLRLAWSYQRPVVLHCFRAWDRLLHILKTQREKIPPKIMSHSHHGNPNLIPELIQRYNMCFSYSSIFVPQNHPKVQACLKATPLDRLLVESDCPDLTTSPKSIIELVSAMSCLTHYKSAVLKKALFQNGKNFIRF